MPIFLFWNAAQAGDYNEFPKPDSLLFFLLQFVSFR